MGAYAVHLSHSQNTFGVPGSAQNYRVITMTTNSSRGSSLGGSVIVTFDGEDVSIAANATASECEDAWETLDNVEDVTVTRSSVGARGDSTYTITFLSFPLNPHQNNIFSHDGNPDISTFTCDISDVTGSDPSCVFDDSVYTNIREYETCSRRGNCDYNIGLCECYTDFVNGNCGRNGLPFAPCSSLSLPLD